MEFKAFTDLSFMLATRFVSQPNMNSRFILGHSDYGKHLGVTDQEIVLSDLPKLFSKTKDGYYFSFVHQHQVAIFEHMFFDLLRIILKNQPRSISGKKQIDYATIFEADSKDDIVFMLVEKEINELKYKNTAEWFNYLYKLVSIPQILTENLEKICEAKASRDILVHNNGIVNEIYIQKSGAAARFQDGAKIDVSGDYTKDMWQLFSMVLLEVTDAVISKHTPEKDIA
jgi:hypothetical protein